MATLWSADSATRLCLYRDAAHTHCLQPPVLRPVQARDIAETEKNTQIGPVHLGLALLDQHVGDGFLQRVLVRAGGGEDTAVKFKAALRAALAKLPRQDPAPTDISPDSNLMKIFRAADASRKKSNDSHVSIDTLASALPQDSVLNKALTEAGVNTAALMEALKAARGTRQVQGENAESTFEALTKYGTDLGKSTCS